MAKRMIRYLLEGNRSTPLFVSNGGYFKVGHEWVGVSVDEDMYFIPSSVRRMNKAELVARITDLEMTPPMTLPEKLAMIEVWLANLGMSDLA